LETEREGDRRGASSALWTGHYGSLRLSALQDRVVIDRCAAEIGIIEWSVRGGGTRNAGLRPIAIDPGILQNRANFFQGLRASVAEVGIKLPLLVWGINGKLWLRYGASRVHVARQLGFLTAPAILCDYGTEPPSGFVQTGFLYTPLQILTAFGPPSVVGHFIVDHEKIDAHRMEP
jgi:hypothetical protein